MFPFSLNFVLPDVPTEDGERHGIIGVLDPNASRPLITEPIDISGPEWKAFEELANECLNTRRPSEAMLQELTRRRDVIRKKLAPTFAKMELQQAFGTAFSNYRNGGIA